MITVNEPIEYVLDYDVEPYADGVIFDVALVSEHDHFNHVLSKLVAELNQYGKDNKWLKMSRKRYMLKILAINMIKSLVEHKPVVVSRDMRAYRSSMTADANRKDRLQARHSELFISYDNLIPVIDWMVERGYIAQDVGYFDKVKGEGKRTRLRPTHKFLSLLSLCSLSVVEPIYETISYNSEYVQYVVLTDEEKGLIEYKDTQETKQYRNELTLYNELLASSTITYVNGITKETVTVENDEGELVSLHTFERQGREERDISIPLLNGSGRNPNKDGADIAVLPDEQTFDRTTEIEGSLYPSKASRSYLKRQFTRGDDSPWTYGGRYYFCSLIGKTPQNMSKPERGSILIDGERTVELDYEAFHIHMLYSPMFYGYASDVSKIVNSHILKNPYNEQEIGLPRALIKQVILIVINAKNYNEAKRALLKKLIEKPEWAEYRSKLDHVIKAVVSYHYPIAGKFYSDVGILLQRIDSDMARYIVNHFAKMGVLCLPVHDSFVVKEEYREELLRVMTRAYKAVMNCSQCPPIHERKL